MRDKHYPVKQFRISEEVYEKMVELKGNKTWNLLFKDFLKR